MSTLEKLISQLCPEGVEYKPLGEVCKCNRTQALTKDQLDPNGAYPVVNSTTGIYGRYKAFNNEGASIIIASHGVNAGNVSFITGKYWAGALCYPYQAKNRMLIDIKYIYFVLKNEQKNLQCKLIAKGSIPFINRSALDKYLIPLPPLPVQKEIVRMLDDTAGLIDALEEELAARKKQYEWCRERMLTFGDDVEGKTLGEIGRVTMCKRIFQNQTSSNGDVPFYKIGTFGKVPDAYISRELFNEYKKMFSYPKKGAVLVSAAGTIGRTVVFNGDDAYFQDSNIVWLEHDESVVINKYLYYCYQLSPWKVATGGTVSRLYNSNIEAARIPVPSIPVQERIVRKLDDITALISALEDELAARKQQYEYYRDKLLAFKRKPEVA